MCIWRIKVGIPGNLSDFDFSMTPFEAGLGSFIELDDILFANRFRITTEFRALFSVIFFIDDFFFSTRHISL